MKNIIIKILWKFFGITPFGKNRFPKSYQKQVGMNASKMLHLNSIELVEFVDQNQIFDKINSIFELGSGPARNLYYFNKKKPTLKISCSDLFKESSFKNMDPDIADKINFFEGDSEEIIKNLNDKIDLFLISDHLMHLQYKKADVIIKEIINRILPDFLLLRELKKEFENPNHPRLYHNYDQINEKYNLIDEKSSDQDPSYFIKLFKRRK